MAAIDEITKQIMLEDIKNLPARLSPKDIYNYYGDDIGRDRAYDIAKQLGYRFRKGGKIFVNKTDFIKFVYDGGRHEITQGGE
jgi:hypothetical protein